MRETVVGSILHGAYGDYYEQAICLKHFRLTHPNVHLKLFAASAHRLAELQVLDFSWADSFELWSEIERQPVDSFFQFQVFDSELRSDVLAHLSPAVAARFELQNRLPWHYLRSILPLAPQYQIALSEYGRRQLPEIVQRNGLNDGIFNRTTIGFLWRYRTAGGAIYPFLQPNPRTLVEKYSRLFRRFIELYNCHVLICGMKVHRTEENKYRIDAKYPDYGLDLPEESSTHLKGLSWALELEILSRCTVCVVHPSGFSEALWMKRNNGMCLIDPPLHYLLKAVGRRMPLFNLLNPTRLATAVASRSYNVGFRMIKSELDQILASPGQHHPAREAAV